MTHSAKSAMRQMKNIAKGYSDIEQKVREATSNDPWGPSGALMSEIANATFNPYVRRMKRMTSFFMYKYILPVLY